MKKKTHSFFDKVIEIQTLSWWRPSVWDGWRLYCIYHWLAFNIAYRWPTGWLALNYKFF